MPTSPAIGQSLRRLDGGEKVSGLTRYAADVKLPGTLHARLVLSPHAHARIASIDGRAASALPGVVGVFGAEDLGLAHPDPSDRGSAPLAIDRTLFVGHPVAAVVAETEAIAEDGASLVEITYEVLPAAVDAVDAMRADAPRVRQQGDGASGEAALAAHGAAVGGQRLAEATGPNVVSTQHFTRGEVARGLAEADVVVERRYTTPMVHQGYLEPRAALASVDPLGVLTIWTSTQGLFGTRSEVAETLGLPEHRLRVIATPIGGGFGAKFVLLEPLAGALAMKLKRPVSVVMTRSEEFLATTPAPPSIFELKTGATRDGRLTAIQARAIFDAGAYAGAPLGIALLMLGSYYQAEHLDLRGYEVLTHKPGNGAYRAPGAVQATFALESQMDEMARALGMDPIDFRLRNASKPGDDMVTGRPWPPMGLSECLERLRAERDRRGTAAATDGRRRGVGVAIGGWMGGIEPASAACRLDRDGTVTIVVGTVDLSGTNTAFAQIAADAFGLPADDVHVVNGDSESAPYAGASGGSKTVYTVGAAVERAAREARRQVLLIAADMLEAAVADLEIMDRAIRVRGVPDRALGLSEIAKACMQFGAKYEPVYGRGSSATITRSPAFAAHLTEVEVDPESGQARVVDHLVVQDVGRAINPAAIEGQIQGAVAQGVGWALLEHMAYDGDGQLLSGTLMDYPLPQSDQAPPVRTAIVELASDHGPFGAKGVGEPPVVAAPAAIANAIADATGRRFTELPITAEKIRAALAAPR